MPKFPIEKKEKITILIPAPLRTFTNGEKKWTVKATFVQESLQKLVTEFPLLKSHLFDRKGHLNEFVTAFVNDENIKNLQGENTSIKEGDIIYIIPAITGGL